jgi:drug/metabolite transporter (DMT)-like permease
VIKLGVSALPPIWFAALRYAIATACLFVVNAARGRVMLPPRSDVRLVLVSGVLQMAAYAGLTSLALTQLPSGRASVLAFSTPLWVVPLAAWRLAERVTVSAAVGVAIGIAGILAIATPALQRGGEIAPYAMLLGAAVAWAISIVTVRAHRFTATPLDLAPWQTLAAALILTTLARLVDGPVPNVGGRAWMSLAYVGPIATAFAYWAMVQAGRHLRASTISMALLATPSLGVAISALAFGERITASLVVGIALTALGIGLATTPGVAKSARYR